MMSDERSNHSLTAAGRATIRSTIATKRPTMSIIPNIFDFKRAKYEQLAEDVKSTDWDLVLLPDDVNQKIACFYDTLHKLLGRHVPKRKPCRRWSKPGMSPALVRLPNQQRFAGRRASRTRLQQDAHCYDVYCQPFAALNTLIMYGALESTSQPIQNASGSSSMTNGSVTTSQQE